MWYIFSGLTIVLEKKIYDISPVSYFLHRYACVSICMVHISVCIRDDVTFRNQNEFNLDYRDHCHLFASESTIDGLMQLLTCSPAVLWFTSIAVLHIIWISSLCLTILVQVHWTCSASRVLQFWFFIERSQQGIPPMKKWIPGVISTSNRSILIHFP